MNSIPSMERPAIARNPVKGEPADLFPAPLPVESLATLATQINQAHADAERTARTAIEHARAAGDKLLLAKAQVEHGQWLPWLAANCPAVAARTASAYMRISRNWGSLETKSADSADLSIDAALKLLNAPEPAPVDESDPLETWLSCLLTDSSFPVGSLGWRRDIPPAVLFLDAIGWTTPAIADRLSIPEKTIRALLDPQPFERPDLLRHKLNPDLAYLEPVIDRCQREYRWHVAAQLTEQRGFFCRGVSAIARKFSRNDLAERFAGMEQVYFREGERAQARIPEWRDASADINESDLLLIGSFLAANHDNHSAMTGDNPEWPDHSVARFIAKIWLTHWNSKAVTGVKKVFPAIDQLDQAVSQ